MSNKKIGIIFLALAVLIIAGFGVWKLTDSDSVEAPATQTSVETSSQANSESIEVTSEPAFTPEEVAQHNVATDCWTIIDSKVYDITSYISRHPGGNEILAACGTDGTTLFNQRTTSGGERVGSGTPHSRSAADQLATFYIGIVIN